MEASPSIDVEPSMARWNGIENTVEIHPTEVVHYVRQGWVILMSYQRRVDLPHQEYQNNYVLNTTRSAYEPVVLMGQTKLDALQAQVVSLSNRNTALSKCETDLNQLKREHVELQRKATEAEHSIAEYRVLWEGAQKDKLIVLQAKQKMETDIGKLRHALGDLRMKRDPRNGVTMTMYDEMLASFRDKDLTGVDRIALERARQIDKEGYNAEHDDDHTDGSLAMAAACYAASVAGEDIFEMRGSAKGVTFVDPWPWEERFDARPHNGNVLKPPTPGQAVRLLEKAGALIAAELDRLLRELDKQDE